MEKLQIKRKNFAVIIIGLPGTGKTTIAHMVASELYGVIRGVWKGIKRLKRCHAPNGREDYP